jgi:nucleotide-binding universal stress UspA family protein
VPQRARLNDLVVLGQSGRVTDKPHSDTLEETVVHGGRPVLLAPARALGPIGEVIAIAWNASPEAARAVSGALPFLVEARAVHILSVGKEDDSLSDAELAAYLGWHGVTAVAHHVPPVKGVKTGEALLAAARDQSADLLVMGGYGHAPWREMIFGGATAQIVGTSLLPVLLSH